MKILEFVITGGPCAGKTTAINIIKKELTKNGFKVIVAAETATELINSGICPWEIEVREFIHTLISRALNKEKTIREVAKCIEKDVVIIYDRGILDCKAYILNNMFEKELQIFNEKEEKILENYDAVFHLVTAANGAEEYYTLSNNVARKESLEEARVLDEKTILAWEKHKNHIIIDNSTNFTEKINRLLKEMYKAIEKCKN